MRTEARTVGHHQAPAPEDWTVRRELVQARLVPKAQQAHRQQRAQLEPIALLVRHSQQQSHLLHSVDSIQPQPEQKPQLVQWTQKQEAGALADRLLAQEQVQIDWMSSDQSHSHSQTRVKLQRCCCFEAVPIQVAIRRCLIPAAVGLLVAFPRLPASSA